MNTTPENRAVVTLDDFCRLCLRQCGSEQMYPWRGRARTDEAKTFPEMLMFVCGLPAGQHAQHELPQRICRDCSGRLEQAYRFCHDFREGETIWDRVIASGPVLQKLITYQNMRFGSESLRGHTQNVRPLPVDIRSSSGTVPIRAGTIVMAEEPLAGTSSFDVEVITLEQVVPGPSSGCSRSPTRSNSQHGSEPPIAECSTEQTAKSKPNPPMPLPMREQPVVKIEPLDISTYQRSNMVEPVVAPSSRPIRGSRRASRRAQQCEVDDGQYSCVYCKSSSDSTTAYANHYYAHKMLKQGRYKCATCGKRFMWKKLLVEHVLRGTCTQPEATQ